MDERAIALCGGGAKGAYEIGAIKALTELGVSFDIVTGTSIGAVTGAMIVKADFDNLYHLWDNMRDRKSVV